MNNIFTKRTFTLVAVSAVAIGMMRKYAKDPANKDSFITKIADTIGLTA